jgi:hypothetical protein
MFLYWAVPKGGLGLSPARGRWRGDRSFTTAKSEGEKSQSPPQPPLAARGRVLGLIFLQPGVMAGLGRPGCLSDCPGRDPLVFCQ